MADTKIIVNCETGEVSEVELTAEEGVNSAGFGPSFVLLGLFGSVALPKDVIADKAIQDSEVNGSGRACAESQHLVSVGLLGECVLAEGSHR